MAQVVRSRFRVQVLAVPPLGQVPEGCRVVDRGGHAVLAPIVGPVLLGPQLKCPRLVDESLRGNEVEWILDYPVLGFGIRIR